MDQEKLTELEQRWSAVFEEIESIKKDMGLDPDSENDLEWIAFCKRYNIEPYPKLNPRYISMFYRDFLIKQQSNK